MTARRPWTKTSASQHSAFQSCQRYWYFGWIERLPRATSEAMQRGKDIHAETEHYLKTGNVRDSSYTEDRLNYRPYVEALVPHLPPPQHEDLIIEHPISIMVHGIEWVGFIDLGFSPNYEPLQIKDIKTTSDFRYAKTPAELQENIQLISYARWAYEIVGYRGPMHVGHIYLKTEKNKVPKKPKTMYVETLLDEDHVNDVWRREMQVLDQMREAALADSAHDLPPTISSCSRYGGCPFREQCGLDLSLGSLFSLTKNSKEKGTMGFLDKLKEKKGDKHKGTLSSDAPSRETSDEEAAEITQTAAEKKKKLAAERKAAKAAAKAAKEAAKAKTDEDDGDDDEKPKASAKKNGKPKTNGFSLYIDCMPTKNVHGGDVEPTLFEDWFAPLVMQMNEFALEEKKQPSYLLLPFAEEKALVQMAVADAIDRLPPVMIVNSGTPGAKDALAGLIPHASLVVRATR